MIRSLALGAIAVLVVGCDSKPTSESGGSAAKPAPAPPAPVPKIVCAKAIPKAIVDKYFAKATTEHGEAFSVPDGGWLTSCRFQEAEPDRRTVIAYRCGPPFADLALYLSQIESQVAVKYERIPGIGRGAYKSKLVFGAQHRTLPCIIEVETIRGEPIDPKPLVTELEAALEAALSPP